MKFLAKSTNPFFVSMKFKTNWFLFSLHAALCGPLLCDIFKSCWLPVGWFVIFWGFISFRLFFNASYSKKHVNLCSRHLLMKSCYIVGICTLIIKFFNKYIEYVYSKNDIMAISIFQLQFINRKINPKFWVTWASLKINIQNDDLLNHPYSKNSLNNIDKLVIILHGAKFSDLAAVYCPGIRIKLSPYIKVTKLKACETPILILKKDSDILDALHI